MSSSSRWWRRRTVTIVIVIMVLRCTVAQSCSCRSSSCYMKFEARQGRRKKGEGKGLHTWLHALHDTVHWQDDSGGLDCNEGACAGGVLVPLTCDMYCT